MRLVCIALLGFFSVAIFVACGGKKSQKNSESISQQKKFSEVKVSDFEERAKNPCNFIDEAMVTKHFDVSAEDLEKDEYVREKLSSMDYCTYRWEKEDIDAINERNQKIIMDPMKSGDTKNAVKEGMAVEKTHKFVGVTNLKLYDDIEKAIKYFENSHKKPTQKDLDKLDEEFDKKSDNNDLSEKQKEVGKDIGGGISDNLKFKQIKGLGDYAYWDDLGSKVDVLVGKIQFGVKIHTGEGVEKDIEMGTIIAKEILSKL